MRGHNGQNYIGQNAELNESFFLLKVYDEIGLISLYLSVVNTVGLHHIEQRLLPGAVLLLEHVVLWVGPGYVSVDGLQ